MEKHAFKHYRIGNFAKRLSVTTSFLKHYEDEDLIHSTQLDNGYRYYAFPESARILEYMRLHSYGVPLKEMRNAVTGTPEAAVASIDAHAESIRETVRKLEAVLAEHERFRAWYDEMEGEPERWEVKKIKPIYFLPHTSGQDFLDDDRIYEVLGAWCGAMPLTKSALWAKNPLEKGNVAETYWGLAVSEENLKRAGIPVNGAVKKIPACHAFIYHFFDLPHPSTIWEVAQGQHPAFDKMRELGFHPAGDALFVIEMKLEKDGVKRGFGRVVIPISE